MVAGDGKAPAAYFCKPRKATFLIRHFYNILTAPLTVQMFVLNDEIANMDEAYEDNMGFLDEMEGERFSNNKANVEKYGFKYATVEQIGEMLREADHVIPF